MITSTTQKPGRNQKPKYEKNMASSLSTSGKSGVNHEPNPKEPNKQKRSCPTDSSKYLFCGQGHKLDDCQHFCKKPFSERRNNFFRERLCMGCAISKSRQVKDCKERSKCKTCSGMHPTCLQKGQSQVDVVVSNCVRACMLPDQSGRFDHTLIVPVSVRPVGLIQESTIPRNQDRYAQYLTLQRSTMVSASMTTCCKVLILRMICSGSRVVFAKKVNQDRYAQYLTLQRSTMVSASMTTCCKVLILRMICSGSRVVFAKKVLP